MMTDHGCVDMTDKGILERLTASVSLLVQERDCFARERDDALARAERAEANLVDLTPMVADCETLRTLAAAQSKEITRLRFALDATGAERDNAEGRVARLTGEVERLWACVQAIDCSATRKMNEMAGDSASVFMGFVFEIGSRDLPALETALGIAAESEGKVKP